MNNSPTKIRWSIRAIFLSTVAIGLLCALFSAATNYYYGERHRAQAKLAQVRGISYEVSTTVDVVEEVARVHISIDAIPNSQIVLVGSDIANSKKDHLELHRIGPWRFNIRGRGALGARDIATGAPVDSDYIGHSISLGPDSPYNKLLPFRIHTLQDLIDHYPQLIEHLETWPTQTAPGTITLADGSQQQFYVTRDPK